MSTKTKIVLVAALVLGSASVALAQDADPNLLNRYPVYNGAVAAQGAVRAPRTFQSAPVALRRGGALRNAPTRGAGHLPHAFVEQEQTGYPQSPPGF
jgi:hypothetical protein